MMPGYECPQALDVEKVKHEEHVANAIGCLELFMKCVFLAKPPSTEVQMKGNVDQDVKTSPPLSVVQREKEDLLTKDAGVLAFLMNNA